MLLKQQDIVLFLLKNGLLSEKEIVEGSLEVIDVSRRNHNFKVTNELGLCYLLKQGLGSDRAQTIKHETKVYQFLQSIPGVDTINFLPKYYAYDPEQCLLIVELLPNTQSLEEYYHLHKKLSQTLAKKLGKVLGAFHFLTSKDEVRNLYRQQFSSSLPSILYFHQPGIGIFRNASSANIELVKIVQNSPEFCEFLDLIIQEWKSETLIHGDIRWDNCCAYSSSAVGRRKDIKIVDWELASWGDPCWDVGTVFSEFLKFWLFSMPVSSSIPLEQCLQLARYPIKTIQPATRSFWQSYIQQMNLDKTEADEWLYRSVRYAGVKLLQSIFEYMQSAMNLTEQAIYLLQLSSNVLRNPQVASVQLLGIS
jgi:thiamine kinase-like enzyme